MKTILEYLTNKSRASYINFTPNTTEQQFVEWISSLLPTKKHNLGILKRFKDDNDRFCMLSSKDMRRYGVMQVYFVFNGVGRECFVIDFANGKLYGISKTDNWEIAHDDNGDYFLNKGKDKKYSKYDHNLTEGINDFLEWIF